MFKVVVMSWTNGVRGIKKCLFSGSLEDCKKYLVTKVKGRSVVIVRG